MRRLLIPPFVLLALLALVPTAGAQAPPPTQARGHVDVIEVNGLLDRVLVDFVSDAVGTAERGGAVALVLQLDSGGAVVGRRTMDALVRRLSHATVPVAVWVGPSGARAEDEAVRLVRAARLVGVAPGSHIDGGPDAVAAPTLGDLVVELDGTSEIVREGEQLRRRPTVAVRFEKLGLVPRLLHTAASPSAAYFLLVAGLALVVFELYTAGIGVAAAVGALFLALAGYGLAELPTRPWATALVALGVFGYAVDVQAGAPRTWTVVGTVLLAGGSVRLYDGYSPSVLVLVVVVAGVALFMVAGMPSMVRSRFSTPTIGRESMVGEVGAALGALDPEGTVQVRGAPWRARTNRATPIAAGASVRVVGIDGLLLEVEPREGGARDYRRH